MPLPILQTRSTPTSVDLIRLYLRTELHWCQHLAESTVLDVGTVLSNPNLKEIWDANQVIDAYQPVGMSASTAVDMVETFFNNIGTRCCNWHLNPSLPESSTRPLRQLLIDRGCRADKIDLMYLSHLHAPPVKEISGLKIIPARASFKHSRMLAEEACQQAENVQMADAWMLHLDDPHWDSLLAIKDGRAVASIGVLAAGEVGRVDQVFVSQPFRQQGIGTVMMGRALEICARSLFKHVLLGVAPDNVPAIRLYERFGWKNLGQIEVIRS